MNDRHNETSRFLHGGLAGNSEDLDAFARRISPLLIAVAQRYVRELQLRVDPLDLVNDAWAACLPKLPTLQPREGHLTRVAVKYLSQAIRHRAGDIMKGGKRFQTRDSQFAQDDPMADTMGIVSRVVQAEQRGQVLEAINALEKIDRDVLVMCSIEQTPQAEIALILEIHEDAVKKRHSRAKLRLKDVLQTSCFDELD